jgi:hypothetical protein
MRCPTNSQTSFPSPAPAISQIKIILTSGFVSVLRIFFTVSETYSCPEQKFNHDSNLINYLLSRCKPWAIKIMASGLTWWYFTLIFTLYFYHCIYVWSHMGYGKNHYLKVPNNYTLFDAIYNCIHGYIFDWMVV